MSSQLFLIFDVDGTLFQADRVTIPAVQETFAAHGLPVPDAKIIATFFGAHVEDYHAWLVQQCPLGMLDVIVEQTDKRELELIAEAGALYPGAIDTLRLLKESGCTIATSSNAPQDYFDEVLDHHGLRELVDIPMCRADRFKDKIEMTGYLLAQCETRPAVVIGDRVDDVRAASAHGIYSVAALYGFGNEREWQGAHARIAALAELPEALAQLNGYSRGRRD
ncbi:MAG: hypothetical protein AMXMBFR84_11420 [Candidatus Hydrogenedentota bacterium]